MLQIDTPITRLSIDDALSFYEVDTACRLSNVIGSIAETMMRAPVVYVHIPIPEYILFMLGHLQGSNDHRVMREWLDAVEQRGALVQRLFRRLLANEAPQLKVEMGSPLDDLLMPLLRQSISAGTVPTPGELVSTILRSGSKLAAIMEAWFESRSYPRSNINYYALAHFGYAAGVVANTSEKGLTIEVENPSEEPIFRAASQVIKRAWSQGTMSRQTNLLAIYPYEQTVAHFEQSIDSCSHVRGYKVHDVVDKLMRQYGADGWKAGDLIDAFAAA